MAKPVIAVVAAALFDGAGRVLIADRPLGKLMSGRWEFPGGKIAPGESEGVALARELLEELGIEFVSGRPFMALEHEYADRHIQLSMWVVDSFRGEPRGLDGQQLKWVEPARLHEEDMLEADRPFIEELQRMCTMPAR